MQVSLSAGLILILYKWRICTREVVYAPLPRVALTQINVRLRVLQPVSPSLFVACVSRVVHQQNPVCPGDHTEVSQWLCHRVPELLDPAPIWCMDLVLMSHLARTVPQSSRPRKLEFRIILQETRHFSVELVVW